MFLLKYTGKYSPWITNDYNENYENLEKVFREYARPVCIVIIRAINKIKSAKNTKKVLSIDKPKR